MLEKPKHKARMESFERKLKLARASANEYRAQYHNKLWRIRTYPEAQIADDYEYLGYLFSRSLVRYQEARKLAAIARKMRGYRRMGDALHQVDARIAWANAEAAIPRFSVLQDQLLQALKDIKGGYPDIKKPGDFLTHVRVEAQGSEVILSLNGETARIGAKVDRPGLTAIHFDTLFDLVKLLMPDRVDFDRDSRRQYRDTTLHGSVITLRCGFTRATFTSGLKPDLLMPPRKESEALATFVMLPDDKRRLSEVIRHACPRMGVRVTTTEKHIRFEASDGHNYAACSIPAGVDTPDHVQWFEAKAFKKWVSAVKTTVKNAPMLTLTAGGFRTSKADNQITEGNPWKAQIGEMFTTACGKVRCHPADLSKLPANNAHYGSLEVRDNLLHVRTFDESDAPMTDKAIDCEGRWTEAIRIADCTLEDLRRIGKLIPDTAYLHLIRKDDNPAIALAAGNFQFVAMGKRQTVFEVQPKPAEAVNA